MTQQTETPPQERRPVDPPAPRHSVMVLKQLFVSEASSQGLRVGSGCVSSLSTQTYFIPQSAVLCATCPLGQQIAGPSIDANLQVCDPSTEA